MDGRAGALVLYQTEDGAGRAVDDGEGVHAGRAERDAGGRVVAAGPDVAGVGVLQLRQLGGALERGVAEDLPVLVVQRRLESRRPYVTVQHAVVLVVEDRGLDSPAEQRLRFAHEVLVERVLAGDERSEPVPTTARPAPLLTEARDGAGEADRDDRVEQADVDPELERVRRRDAEQLARGEPLLDLAALGRRVAGAVGREP